MLGVADSIAEEHLRNVRIKSDFVSAACPFHKGGQELHPSFWIDRRSGRWGCFTCSASGSALRYLLKELGVGSRRVQTLLEDAEKDAARARAIDAARRRKKAREPLKGRYILPDALLGVYDWCPTELLEAGFSEAVLQVHEVGFDRELERITFPLRDALGNLIGISGRARQGELPKYKIYNGNRTLEGKEVKGELGRWYPEYSNDGVRDHLWRSHFIHQELLESINGQVIIVEGFKAAMWLVQLGWPNVVALLGDKISPAQEKLLRKWGAETWVLLDNNSPGREGAYRVAQRLAESTFPVYRCRYPDHCSESAQPDDLSEEELEVVLQSAERAGGKANVRQRLARDDRARPNFRTSRWR